MEKTKVCLRTTELPLNDFLRCVCDDKNEPQRNIRGVRVWDIRSKEGGVPLASGGRGAY